MHDGKDAICWDFITNGLLHDLRFLLRKEQLLGTLVLYFIEAECRLRHY